MNLKAVQAIADAVLYEGYLLYPYRPSSAKNRQRWTFGGLYPRAWSEASGSDPSALSTQCLIEGGAGVRLDVRLRFLQPFERGVGRLNESLSAWPAGGKPGFTAVPSLRVGKREFHAWQEAAEREIELQGLGLDDLLGAGVQHDFLFAAEREMEPLCDEEGAIRGVLLRRRESISGRMTVSAVPVAERVYRLTLQVENRTLMESANIRGRDAASVYSFASTHMILMARDGAFVSPTDPPEALAELAATCRYEGAWPLLVGEAGSRDVLLCSPIILPDYPQVAPESPGDLYDGTEIDEILSLRILTMTDAEKREMAVCDPRAAKLLARTEALGAEDFMRLHGTLRDPDPPHLVSLRENDLALQVGDHVRLHPKPGGDVMDLVLDGKAATIEAIERDFEGRVHVAVTIDDDPGREWGDARMPGHRFFFSPTEIELLQGAPREARA